MITREESLRKIQAFIDFCPAIKTEMEFLSLQKEF